jgi:hypothetical protein
MARYYRYRKYSRRYRRKGIWSSRINTVYEGQTAGAGDQYILQGNLVQNPAQNENTISSKYTVKNIDFQFEILQNPGQGDYAAQMFSVYIMYVPQGYVPTGVPSAYFDLPNNHPEWIMAHRYIGNLYPQAGNYRSKFTMSSRLARKLDTGDRIIYLAIGQNGSGASATVSLKGLVKYNSKSN